MKPGRWEEGGRGGLFLARSHDPSRPRAHAHTHVHTHTWGCSLVVGLGLFDVVSSAVTGVSRSSSRVGGDHPSAPLGADCTPLICGAAVSTLINFSSPRSPLGTEGHIPELFWEIHPLGGPSLSVGGGPRGDGDSGAPFPLPSPRDPGDSPGIETQSMTLYQSPQTPVLDEPLE